MGEAANSRGGGECAVRELQGWRPRAPGGGGVRGGRELQWKARRQGAAVSSEEAGEAWGEIKRENGREGVKVEDSNFGGFFLHIFMPRGVMSRGMDLSGTT